MQRMRSRNMSLAGWLFADLALALTAVYVADVRPRPPTTTTTTTTTASTSTTTTSTSTTTTTPTTSTTLRVGVDKVPWCLRISGLPFSRLTQDIEGLRDDPEVETFAQGIDQALTESGLSHRRVFLLVSYVHSTPDERIAARDAAAHLDHVLTAPDALFPDAATEEESYEDNNTGQYTAKVFLMEDPDAPPLQATDEAFPLAGDTCG